MLTVTVESRVVKSGRLQEDADPVILELLQEEISVADLIRRTVEEQVRGRNMHRRLQMMDGSTTVASGGPSWTGEVNALPEVEKAQHAFSRGDYLILIDGIPASRLDETLTFAPGTAIHFLRLTPLAGG